MQTDVCPLNNKSGQVQVSRYRMPNSENRNHILEQHQDRTPFVYAYTQVRLHAFRIRQQKRRVSHLKIPTESPVKHFDTH